MSRDQRITVYVSEQERSRIEREADAQHTGLSNYIMSAVEEKWNREDTEETAERTEVEERVERIAAQATDNIEAMIEQQQKRTEQMADMVARSAVYSIANFESLKYSQKLPEAVKTNSLKIGARRLGDPLDLDADQEAATAEGNLSDSLDSHPAEPESEPAESSGGIKEGFFDRHA
jgi:uncharacterized membrane protein